MIRACIILWLSAHVSSSAIQWRHTGYAGFSIETDAHGNTICSYVNLRETHEPIPAIVRKVNKIRKHK